MQLSIIFLEISERLRNLLFSKTMVFHCQGILFDLDGVLVDSRQAVERVWRGWAAEHSIDAELVLGSAHGRRTIDTVRLVAPHLDAQHEDTVVEEREIADGDGVIAVAGAGDLLASLGADRFAVVTSASEALARARMGFAALSMPARFVTADRVTHGKPHPEPYLKGAELLGFPAQDCVVFEDTAAGIQSGKAAGMKVVGLTTTYPASALKAADAIVKNLRGVKAEVANGRVNLTLPA